MQNELEDQALEQKRELIESFTNLVMSVSEIVEKLYGNRVISVAVHPTVFESFEFAYSQFDLNIDVNEIDGIDIDKEKWLSPGDLLVKFGDCREDLSYSFLHSLILDMNDGSVKYHSLAENIDTLKNQLFEIEEL